MAPTARQVRGCAPATPRCRCAGLAAARTRRMHGHGYGAGGHAGGETPFQWRLDFTVMIGEELRQ